MEEMIYRKFLEWLEEDMPYFDVTSSLIPEGVEVKATVIAREKCVLAFAEEAKSILERLGLRVILHRKNGESVRDGERIMTIEGKAKTILTVERTLLNILGRASGVATETRKAVEAARRLNPKIKVAATRKTTPGLRLIEKLAVIAGGGDPHRMGLSDMVLIKDNHIKVMGSIVEAVDKARELASFTKKVEVEVESVDEALEAARARADIIMLDNMSPEDVRRVIDALRSEGLKDRVLVEASGGITLENIGEYAATGADIISLGSITRHARIIDFTLEVLEVKNG